MIAMRVLCRPNIEISTLQALDFLFSKMQSAGFPFGRVVGMSGCGQQHGSVYWKKGSEAVLKNLDSSQTLAEQLKVEIEAQRNESACRNTHRVKKPRRMAQA